MSKLVLGIFCLFSGLAFACVDEGLAYPHCHDQTELFKRGLDQAVREHKMLVVTYGYQKCVWSRSLAATTQLFAVDPELSPKFVFVTLAAPNPIA